MSTEPDPCGLVEDTKTEVITHLPRQDQHLNGASLIKWGYN